MRLAIRALTGAAFLVSGQASVAQDFLELYRRVNPAVAVINTAERGPSPTGGQVAFQGLGSGVLIDANHVLLERNAFWSGISFLPLTNDLTRQQICPQRQDSLAAFLLSLGVNSDCGAKGRSP